MTVSTTESGESVTIHVQGRFDFAIHSEFQGAWRNFNRGEKTFIVDFADTEYMDSSAMGMLLQLRDHGKSGARVELINGSDSIKEILRIANFDKLFDVM